MRSVEVVGVVALAGCGTYTQYQTAEPLPAGRWQLAVASTSGEFFDLAQKLPTPSTSVELAARHGLGDDTDVGMKLYTLGTEASVRHRFTNDYWQYAGMLAIGGAYTPEYLGTTKALNGQLRVAGAATHRFGAGFAVTVGPSLTGSLFLPAGGGWSGGVLAGAFTNVELSFGKHERWHLVPELSLHVTVVGDVPVSGAVAMGGLSVARDF